MKREFYLQDDKSNKFWTIELSGTSHTTTHGRIGTAGKVTRKEFASEELAKRDHDKLIASKVKKGYIEGKIAEAPAHARPDWAAMVMSEDVFWRLIGLFNWQKLGDDEAVIKPAVTALSQMTVADIQRFKDILAEKLYALDTEAHGREIGEGAFVDEENHFSVDEFLYSRCVVVANGRNAFEVILADPMQMPKNCEFEVLLTVPGEAYAKKTGEEFDYSSPVCYETFSNRAGWNVAGPGSAPTH
jgi:predicted DNA-binding WGR domain protein